MISPVAGFPRYALNDERVGHPHPIAPMAQVRNN